MHPLLNDLISLRKRYRQSQRSIAAAVGIDRTSILRVESEERGLRLEEAAEWASACGARLVLVREGEDLGMLEEGERRLVEGVRGLKDWQRGLVEQLVAVLPALTPQTVAMLSAQLDAAARLASSSSGGGALAASDGGRGPR